MKIEEKEITAEQRLAMNLIGMQRDTRQYLTDSGCRILVSAPQDGAGWHLSIAHPERFPTWDEIKQARYELLPGNKNFAMLLPPENDYVNIHPNTFHLWQVVGRYQSINLIHDAAFG